MELIQLFTDSPEIELFGRLLLAMVLGIILGTERIRAHKTAGPRTYGLVAMGAALFVITGELVTNATPDAVIDNLRVAAQIIAGVGFLGAGVIMVRENHVIGITTASGLWVSAGIGMAVGFGYYLLGIFTTSLTLFLFSIMWKVESKYLVTEESAEKK